MTHATFLPPPWARLPRTSSRSSTGRHVERPHRGHQQQARTPPQQRLGFRNLTNYIARSLLEAGGFKPSIAARRLGRPPVWENPPLWDAFEAFMAGDDRVIAGPVKNLFQSVAERVASKSFKAAQHAAQTKPKDVE